MLSKAQKEITDYILNKNNEVYFSEIEKKFHMRAINALRSKSILKVETQSRHRADDNETVYYSAASLDLSKL